MAEVENKFIVINVKDLKYLTEEYREKLFVITKAIEYGRQDEGKEINDYWVCNQDEPYADQIKSIILIGETKKVIPLEPPVKPANGGHTLSSQKDIELKQGDIVRIPRTGEIKVVAFTDDFGRVWFKENCIGISYVEKLTEEEVSRLSV